MNIIILILYSALGVTMVTGYGQRLIFTKISAVVQTVCIIAQMCTTVQGFYYCICVPVIGYQEPVGITVLPKGNLHWTTGVFS